MEAVGMYINPTGLLNLILDQKREEKDKKYYYTTLLERIEEPGSTPEDGIM
jgi:hypothetical protein